MRWVLGGSLLLFFLAVFFLLNLWVHYRKLDGLLHFLSKCLIRISGMQLEVEGRGHIKPNQTYLYLFNHSNIFDHFAIYAALPVLMRGVEKESHFSWPIYGWFLRKIDQIPIASRGNTQKAIGSLDRAKEMFRSGINIGIAPEGTRSPDGRLLPFKKGAFHVAVDLQAELVPLVFKGMANFNRKNSFLIHPGKVTLRVLPPISTRGKTKKDIAELRDRLYAIYQSELQDEGSAKQPA